VMCEMQLLSMKINNKHPVKHSFYNHSQYVF